MLPLDVPSRPPHVDGLRVAPWLSIVSPRHQPGLSIDSPTLRLLKTGDVMPDFTLDSRLQQDSVPVIDLPLNQIRLSRDARYPWVILVPQRADIVEIYDLEPDEQAQLWEQATRLGRAMMDFYSGDKLNIATLGNVVAQCHLHVIVRFQGDAAWPGPVWGQGSAAAYTDEALEQRRAEIAQLANEANLVNENDSRS